MEEQEKQQQTGRQKITRPLTVIGIITACIGVVVLIFIVVWFYGTGFPGKTLWDWLQLLGVLTIPVVVGFGAAWFTRTQQLRDQELDKLQRARDQEAARIQHERDQQLADQRAKSEQEAIDKRGQIEREAAEKRAQIERDIAQDNQREAALQAYINAMSELLLEKKLRESQPNDEVRKIARIRTLTVLHRLDGKRKRSVLQFIYESDLINKSNRIVELHGADFRQADLKWIHLENAHLGGSLCWKVDFSDAFLHGAYLGGTQFREDTWNGADLSGSYLKGATFLDADGKPREDALANIIKELEKQVKSLQGATMPDGSTHA